MDRDTIVTIIVAIFASSGFWTLILKLIDRKSAKNKMILGLGHDRIIFLCEKYLAQGWCTTDEFENLHDYLYEPYIKMGGNGTAKKLMIDVEKLPTHKKADAPSTTRTGSNTRRQSASSRAK